MPESPDPDVGGPRPQTVRYASGTVQARGTLLDGVAHGAWEWFRKDGTLMRSGHFERGRQVGMWRTYERSGRLVKETDYSKAQASDTAAAESRD
jgi:antitoxin component YwqK of YwqJK toxin-antitoxin module